MKILRQKLFGIKEWLKGQTEGDKRRKEKTVERLSKHKLTDKELKELGLDLANFDSYSLDTDNFTTAPKYKNPRLNTLDKEGKLYEEARKAARKNQIGKAAMITLPVAAAAVGTGIAIKKHKNKKKKEQE